MDKLNDELDALTKKCLDKNCAICAVIVNNKTGRTIRALGGNMADVMMGIYVAIKSASEATGVPVTGLLAEMVEVDQKYEAGDGKKGRKKKC